MIANERQSQVTRNKLGELAELRASVERGTVGADGFRDLQAQALDRQMEDLREEIAEYERLRDGSITTIERRRLPVSPMR